MAKIKGYDVYFTLKAPACVLVAAKTKKGASEEAKRIIDGMSKAELADRLLAAIDFEGIRIVSIDEVDELEEDDDFECPLVGDETDDCADCPYAGDYHFVNGECVRRENN